MRAKRSLGQNFFINKNLAEHIVNIVRESNVQNLVEIGPGTGFFTEKLINISPNLSVIEKDTQLADTLKKKYTNIEVINKDFLEFNLNDLREENISFFGSLPYNIAKAIIKEIIESSKFQNTSFFIIQKEVADKYIYKAPYSLLSLTTAIYADCKKHLDISPESFRPRPNVNSSLISFTPSKRDIHNIAELELLISKSFRQPRKNLYNNLKGSVFEKGISNYKTYRPAQLSLDEYIDILNHSL